MGDLMVTNAVMTQLIQEISALRKAARKIKCKKCNGRRWIYVFGMKHPCPDCADLLALLATDRASPP